MNRTKLITLKWAMIFIPTFVVLAYEIMRHTLLASELPMSTGNVITAIVVFLLLYLFTEVAFNIIEHMQERLVKQNRQIAIIDERSRLSREMHDGIAQLLAYSMMKMDRIEILIHSQRYDEAQQELENVRGACNDAYSDVREIVSELRPENLQERNFLAIIQSLLNRFADSAHIEKQIEIENIDSDPQTIETYFLPETRVQLIRVFQEALSNIRKHAEATKIHVRIALEDSSLPLSLTISDNGRGFNPANLIAKSHHFGLSSMRERIEELGGQLDIESQHGQGTKIIISLPVPEHVMNPINVRENVRV